MTRLLTQPGNEHSTVLLAAVQPGPSRAAGHSVLTETPMNRVWDFIPLSFFYMLVTHFIFKCLWSFSLWIFPLVLVGQCNSQRRTYFVLNDLCYELTELDEKLLKATWRGSLNAKRSDLLFNFQTLHEQARGGATRWWPFSRLSEYNRNSSSFYLPAQHTLHSTLVSF